MFQGKPGTRERTGEGFADRMCQVSGWQKEVDNKEQGAILPGNDLFNKVE